MVFAFVVRLYLAVCIISPVVKLNSHILVSSPSDGMSVTHTWFLCSMSLPVMALTGTPSISSGGVWFGFGFAFDIGISITLIFSAWCGMRGPPFGWVVLDYSGFEILIVNLPPRLAGSLLNVIRVPVHLV